MAGEQLDMEALADACMRRRAAIGGSSSAWIKRMDEANRDVDALLAEVRRLQAELHKVTGERNGWNIAAHEAEVETWEPVDEAPEPVATWVPKVVPIDDGRAAFLAEQARSEFFDARQDLLAIEQRAQELERDARKHSRWSLVVVLALAALLAASERWGSVMAERRILERMGQVAPVVSAPR